MNPFDYLDDPYREVEFTPEVQERIIARWRDIREEYGTRPESPLVSQSEFERIVDIVRKS